MNNTEDCPTVDVNMWKTASSLWGHCPLALLDLWQHSACEGRFTTWFPIAVKMVLSKRPTQETTMQENKPKVSAEDFS